jgi:hypothetical protein
MKKRLILSIIFLSLMALSALASSIKVNPVTGGATNRPTNVSIFIQAPVPVVTIISPQAITYTSTRVFFNYTATNADNVWYHLDSGANITLTGPRYLKVSGGSHTIYLYANNSYGTSSTNVTFNIEPRLGEDKRTKKICEPIWQCDLWSKCINGFRTRLCTDLTGCSADMREKKPCKKQHSSECSIYVETGWNFISLCSQVENYKIEKVLGYIDGLYSYILEWNEAEQEFQIWSYRGAKPFTYFDEEKSYFIFYEGPDEKINITGKLYENQDINLMEGWESPIYPYVFETRVSGDELYTLAFDYVLGWSRAKQEFEIYSTKAQEKEFDTLYPGEGFFIYSPGGTLKYRK